MAPKARVKAKERAKSHSRSPSPAARSSQRRPSNSTERKALESRTSDPAPALEAASVEKEIPDAHEESTQSNRSSAKEEAIPREATKLHGTGTEDGSAQSSAPLPAEGPATAEEEMKEPIEKSLASAFQVLDVNGDGFISEEEFSSVLLVLGVPKADISAMFRAADTSSNGFIDYASFLSWTHEAPENVQADLNSLVDVNGRRGKIVWDGRPGHAYFQIAWLDTGLVEMVKIGKVFPDQKVEDPHARINSRTSELDDAWKAFQSKFDELTKGLVDSIKGVGGMDALFPDDFDAKELSEPDGKWKSEHEQMCSRLKDIEFADPEQDLFWHGRGYDGRVVNPKVTWESDAPPRDDHWCPDWLTASEFEDESEVINWKVAQLANLLRMSRKTVLYTGAGISADVVGQAARGGSDKTGFKDSPLKAKPTFTHQALGLLARQGWIHSWVNQNHDGLAQKAGFPQECLNEVHGSWYDPSNPVVKYDGSLRKEEFNWMVDDTATADLVIVLGSSLGGLNADRLPKTAAELSRSGKRLGTVCINLQQTPHDGMMTLRLFGTSDDILKMLLSEMHIDHKSLMPELESDYVLVPYDADGFLLTSGDVKKMWLNLNTGVEVRITDGHNIQGARQPKYLHIGAAEPVTYLACRRAPAEPIGFVRSRDDDMCAFVLDIAGVDLNLGLWWLDSAQRGALQKLPIVNLHPQYEWEIPEGPKEVKPDARQWWEKGETVFPSVAEEEVCGPEKLSRALSGEACVKPKIIRKGSF